VREIKRLGEKNYKHVPESAFTSQISIKRPLYIPKNFFKDVIHTYI